MATETPWAFGYYAERVVSKQEKKLVGIQAIYERFADNINNLRRQVLDTHQAADPNIFARDPHCSTIVLSEMLAGSIHSACYNEDGSFDEEHYVMMMDMAYEIITSTFARLHTSREAKKGAN